MGHPRYTAEEIGRRGQELYDRDIHPHVEDEHHGEYLVLDIETGDYEMGDDPDVLSRRLLACHADAALFGLRIGHRGVARIGLGGARVKSVVKKDGQGNGLLAMGRR